MGLNSPITNSTTEDSLSSVLKLGSFLDLLFAAAFPACTAARLLHLGPSELQHSADPSTKNGWCWRQRVKPNGQGQSFSALKVVAKRRWKRRKNKNQEPTAAESPTAPFQGGPTCFPASLAYLVKEPHTVGQRVFERDSLQACGIPMTTQLPFCPLTGKGPVGREIREIEWKMQGPGPAARVHTARPKVDILNMVGGNLGRGLQAKL